MAVEKYPSRPARAETPTGPMLRLPTGAYRHAATAARASSTVLTIGTITPYAPASSTLPMMLGSFHGTRTIGVVSVRAIA